MTLIFAACAAISLATALGVIASRNPVYSALFLVGNLMTMAAMFAALNAHFLAVAQIIVYAGAIMVLFLFVIMLLNVKTEQPASPWLVAVGGIAALSFAAALLKSIEGFSRSAFVPESGPVSAAASSGTVKALGFELYTNYIFPFEVASLLIIAAVVGAVMLSQKVKGLGATAQPSVNARAENGGGK